MVTDIKQDNIIIIIGVLIGIIKPSIIPGINEYEVLIYFFILTLSLRSIIVYKMSNINIDIIHIKINNNGYILSINPTLPEKNKTIPFL